MKYKNFANLADYIRRTHEIQKKNIKALMVNMTRSSHIYEEEIKKICRDCVDVEKILASCIDSSPVKKTKINPKKSKRVIFKFTHGLSVDFPNYKAAFIHFAGKNPANGCRYGVPHRKAVDPKVANVCRLRFFRNLIGGERKLKEIVEA